MTPMPRGRAPSLVTVPELASLTVDGHADPNPGQPGSGRVTESAVIPPIARHRMPAPAITIAGVIDRQLRAA